VINHERPRGVEVNIVGSRQTETGDRTRSHEDPATQHNFTSAKHSGSVRNGNGATPLPLPSADSRVVMAIADDFNNRPTVCGTGGHGI